MRFDVLANLDYPDRDMESLMQKLRTSETADAGPQSINPSLFSSSERRRVSGPGLRTFLALTDL
jgi:hypothetical protein